MWGTETPKEEDGASGNSNAPFWYLCFTCTYTPHQQMKMSSRLKAMHQTLTNNSAYCGSYRGWSWQFIVISKQIKSHYTKLMPVFTLILPENMLRTKLSWSVCSPLWYYIKQRQPREMALWRELIVRDICWQRCISLCVKSPLWGTQGRMGREGNAWGKKARNEDEKWASEQAGVLAWSTFICL